MEPLNPPLLDPAPLRLLVVEDDPELGSLLQEYILGEPYALVILDLMLPGEDGFGVCRQVRPSFAGRILMLTAREDSIDQVLGLELGADDYVRKPVEPRVLLARVRALLRREPTSAPAQPATAPGPARAATPAVLSLAGIALDEGAHEVRVHGEVVEMTEAQCRTLA
jgi:two-component system response regulator RstA